MVAKINIPVALLPVSGFMYRVCMVIDHLKKQFEITIQQHVYIRFGTKEVVGSIAAAFVIKSVNKAKANAADNFT